MMLVKTYLAPSAIHGNGLFAAEPIAKGTVIKANVQGQDLQLSMAYKADGTYTASMDGQQLGGGTYTADGDKLCTKSDLGEGCTPYPAGKKAGDTFEITSPTLGKATVTINK